MSDIVINAVGMTIDDVVAISRHNAKVVLSSEAIAALSAARAHIDALALLPEPIYGISTGFGALATRHVAPELRAQLQRSLIRSHAAGVGEPVEREVAGWYCNIIPSINVNIKKLTSLIFFIHKI